MPNKVKPVPDGYHTLTPYLRLKDAAKTIEFYKKAFGAAETHPPMKTPDGRILHGEIQIGDSRVMYMDEMPEMGAKSPQTLGGTPVMLSLYVDNADVVFNKAVSAGAKVLIPMQNMFYGDRAGGVEDPAGHAWWISTHVEDVPMDELKRRAESAMKEKCAGAKK
jgi:PhnB protein